MLRERRHGQCPIRHAGASTTNPGSVRGRRAVALGGVLPVIETDAKQVGRLQGRQPLAGRHDLSGDPEIPEEVARTTRSLPKFLAIVIVLIFVEIVFFVWKEMLPR